MPGGIQLFADALGVSTKELLRQVESGKLLAEDVLPLVARQMKNVANNGGALALKLKSARVAQGMFFKEMESGSKLIFDSGFSEGLAEMFREMTEEMKLSSAGMKGLSRIFKGFFMIIGTLSQALMPVLDSLFFVLGKITDGFLYLFETKQSSLVVSIGAISIAITALAGGLWSVNSALLAVMANVARVVAPVLAVMSEVDDFLANFDDQRTSTREFRLGRQLEGVGDYALTKIQDFTGYTSDKEFLDRINKQNESASMSNKTEIKNEVYIDGDKQTIRKEIIRINSEGMVEGN